MTKITLEKWEKLTLSKFSHEDQKCIKHYEQLIKNPEEACKEKEIHFLRVIFSNYSAQNYIEEYFIERKRMIAHLNASKVKHDIEDAPIGERNFTSSTDSKWFDEYHKDYGWNNFIW